MPLMRVSLCDDKAKDDAECERRAAGAAGSAAAVGPAQQGQLSSAASKTHAQSGVSYSECPGERSERADSGPPGVA